jgi:hypothetical protein
MNSRAPRRDELERLLGQSGLKLGHDDQDLRNLNNWLAENIEPDPMWPGYPNSDWRSVVMDLALFLGDEMILNNETLCWKLEMKGRKSVSYQSPVIAEPLEAKGRYLTRFDIFRRTRAHAVRILELQGSIPHYGKVLVRGVEVDVDESARRARDRWRREGLRGFPDWIDSVRKGEPL